MLSIESKLFSLNFKVFNTSQEKFLQCALYYNLKIFRHTRFFFSLGFKRILEEWSLNIILPLDEVNKWIQISKNIFENLEWVAHEGISTFQVYE